MLSTHLKNCSAPFNVQHFVLVIGFLFLVSCGGKKEPVDASQIKVGNTVDSVITHLSELEQGSYEHRAFRVCAPFLQRNPMAKDSILGYLSDRSRKENNELTALAVRLLQAHLYLWARQPDSAILIGEPVIKEAIERKDSVFISGSCNMLGSAYWRTDNLLMAKKYFSLGEELATAMKSDYSLFLFSNNLGVLHKENNQYGMAHDYFQNSLAASNRILDSGAEMEKMAIEKMKPMVLQNLITLLVNENHLLELDSIWNSEKLTDQMNDSTYTGQVFTLNRCSQFLRKGKYEESEALLMTLDVERVYSDLMDSYLKNELWLRRVNGSKRYPETLAKNLDVIKGNFPKKLVDLQEELIYLVQEGDAPITLDSLSLWEAEMGETPSNLPPLQMAALSRIKSALLQKAGRHEEANLASMKESEYLVHYYKQHDSVWTTDLSTQLQSDRVKFESEIKQKELDQKRQEAYLLYMGIAFLLLASGAVSYILVQRRRGVEMNLKLKELELQKSEAEKSHLLKEQKLSSRVVSLSKMIVTRGAEIRKKLAQISGQIQNQELDRLKKELDQIINNSDDSHPELADSILEEDYENMERTFANAKLLNLTERRIFALSVEGYRGKEVANILGMSIQYVSNSRTKIRKVLEIDDSLDWIDLKKQVNQHNYKE